MVWLALTFANAFIAIGMWIHGVVDGIQHADPYPPPFKILAQHYLQDLDKLSLFLATHYAHQAKPDERQVAMAIRLLTPGDGSDEAWERLAIARGDRGPEAQAGLIMAVREGLAPPPVTVSLDWRPGGDKR